MSQKLLHFHNSIRSWLENECCCPCTVDISNDTWGQVRYERNNSQPFVKRYITPFQWCMNEQNPRIFTFLFDIVMKNTKAYVPWSTTLLAGIILGVGSASERRRYNVTLSLIGGAHTQNDACSRKCLHMPSYWFLDNMRLKHWYQQWLMCDKRQYPSRQQLHHKHRLIL